MRRARRLAQDESGQNLIEFALLTPVILLFIGVIVVFGMAIFARSSLQQAVREGARQAAVGKSLAEVQTLASDNAPDNVDPEEVQWCLPAGTEGRVGDEIRVYIDENDDGSEGYDFTISAPGGLFSMFGIDSLSVTMRPRATARLEKSLPAGSVDECV